MKNKGFTLIELLAVIVILAIIALIATPIILNIIGDTKDSAVVRSGELYLSAVESAIARENLKGNFSPTECTIQSDGNLVCKDQNNNEVNLKIESNGSRPTLGTIKFLNGKVTEIIGMILDGYELKQEVGDKLVNTGTFTPENSDKPLNPQGTILMERDPNTISAYFLGGKVSRTDIETITITNTNKVPEGNTTGWDVSAAQDGSVMAWYTDTDNNNLYELYIGGEGGVKANPNSSRLFSYFTAVTSIDVSYLDTRDVTNMYQMFYACPNLGYINFGKNFNTSKVTDMSFMFSMGSNTNSSLKTLNLSTFDTSEVTTMKAMFSGCNGLTDIIGLNNLNTNKVTNMNQMFAECSALTKLDLGSFYFSDETVITAMFIQCTSLNTLDAGNLAFTNEDNYYNFILELNDLSNFTSLIVKDSETQTIFNKAISDLGITKINVTIAS